MKIISWNVNGLRAVHNKGLFLPFIEKTKPDIICLQETKSKKEQNEFDLKEYQEYWNSAQRAGYSGTSIFSKIEPIKVMYDFPDAISVKYELSTDKYGDSNKEGRIITAEYKDFYLVNVYTPNSKEDLSRLDLRKNKWDPAFLEHITNLKKIKNVVFCGDLNVAHKEIDLAKPKQNEGRHGFTKEERIGLDNIIKAGFVDIFRNLNPEKKGAYTWWSHFANSRERNIGWRIDYFFVTNGLISKTKMSDILPDIFGSDHCPISIDISI